MSTQSVMFGLQGWASAIFSCHMIRSYIEAYYIFANKYSELSKGVSYNELKRSFSRPIFYAYG